jgi:ubiquinone/menaquinone biosynthesis C-methylase UbiE
MEIHQAAALIRTPLVDWARPQCWCDLGCGSGTFTEALASLLAPGSTIYAVDMDQNVLKLIPDRINGSNIQKIFGDISSTTLRLPAVDGILMANSLHFVRAQVSLLSRLLSLTRQFLIVEYDRMLPNPWGPYPISFNKLCKRFEEAGVKRVQKLTTYPSRFGGTIYSAFATAANT